MTPRSPMTRSLIPLFALASLSGLASLGITPPQASAQEIFELGSPDPSSRRTESDAIPARWPTLPLLEKYQGEERRGVRYLTEAERAQAQLVIKEGALCDPNGALLNPRAGSAQAEQRALTEFPEQPATPVEARAIGFAIYVMDERGELFVSFEAERHAFHHSSLLAGGRVAAAGEMIIINGKLYAINNQSGHYRPPPIALERVIRVLKSRGVKFDGVLVKRFGSDF